VNHFSVYAFYRCYMPDSISWCLTESYGIKRSVPPYGPCGLRKTFKIYANGNYHVVQKPAPKSFSNNFAKFPSILINVGTRIL